MIPGVFHGEFDHASDVVETVFRFAQSYWARITSCSYAEDSQAQPCAYCKRKNRAATCSFSAAKERGQALSAANTPNAPASDRDRNTARGRAHSEGNTHVSRSHQPEPEASPSPTASRDDHHGDTAVPLEGRILRDAQGKVIFIGDCAPLSFLQTVRYLVSSEVDPDGFAVQTSRDSMIEVARPQPMTGQVSSTRPSRADVRIFAEEYCVVTSGLVDLFEREDLLKEIVLWSSSLAAQVDDTAEAVFYLVLAIGAQEKNEAKAEAWFAKAQEVLVKNMCNSMNVATVQGFTLVAIYMLRAFQPNGAYLYFCKLSYFFRYDSDMSTPVEVSEYGCQWSLTTCVQHWPPGQLMPLGYIEQK